MNQFNSRIRILHIIKSLGRGGAEMLLPETLKLHDQTKFEFHYIYFLPWKNQMVEALEQNGAKVTCFPASNNFQIMQEVKRVKRYVIENKIVLIHCHLPWAGILGRVLFKSTGLPVLYTEHNKQERYHFLTRWMNRYTFSRQSAVIAVSKDVADSIRKNINTAIPIHEIPNGVNTGYFQRSLQAGLALRREKSISENAIVIGTIAVFRFQKRLKEWLEVFEKITRKHPDVFGIIVGDGPLKAEILQHSRDLQLDKKLIFPGLQTDVTPWLSAMDVFMMSSVFEGMPVALLEAMSMECAIVTTDAGGTKEVIENEKSGLMVGVDEWPKLENELERVITDQKLRSRLAGGARQRVLEKFSMDRMVKELESLYERYL